ncbi:MAG: hypothetical protein HGA45_15345 [Chloroflexales bacterium]|nr:hypothetical protein [Chloroflexales bacterium]
MRSPLWPILVLFVALHALYNWAIPLGEGPDEPGHLAYVLFLSGEGRLPVQRPAPEAGDVPGEGHQPPLAYALAIPAVAWLPPAERPILLTPNPRFVWAGGDEPAAFMRGSRELWPWAIQTVAWHLARAVSGLWGALAVACTYLAARRLAPQDPRLAVLATALVALNPQVLFTTALVSNDALLTALGAAILWHCLGRPAKPLRWSLVAGTLFGLALLTKQSALALGPLLLWGGWRAARGDTRRFLGLSLTWMLATLAVAGWWLWRNQALYGDIFGLGAFTAEFATQPFAWGDPAAWVGALRQLFGSFWARFGWMSVHPPAWALWLYAGVCALAAFGWARGAVHRRGEGTEIPALALTLALAWTLAFAATAGLVAWQGRMLFPALAAIGVLLARGLLRTLRGSTAVLLSLPLLALAVYMPIGVIRPAYRWVALAPHEAQATLGSPTYGRFAASWERGVVLRGWRLDGPARPAADLALTLTWNSLEPVPRPWTVFIHLVDSDETIVAQSNSQPRGGALPFTLWTPGDWVADPHSLALPTDLPPGEYRLRVGLYRPDKDGRRQKVWAEDGAPLGDYIELGSVQVEP